MSSGLLQVFVKLGNLHGTSNYVVEITIKMKPITLNDKNQFVHCYLHTIQILNNTSIPHWINEIDDDIDTSIYEGVKNSN